MIRDDLKKALVEALKAKDEVKVSTIRLINAAIKDKDIEARPKGNLDGIDDTAVLNLLMSMVKQRNESIQMYEEGARHDLAQKEKAEIEVISLFLPKQMSADEVSSAIDALIQETGASSIKDMGKVMGLLKSKYAGKMDFATASGMIKSKLGA